MQGSDPRIGTVLQDRYLLLERVGEGAMAVVYRGQRVGLNREVAIKFLSEAHAADQDTRRRFEVEAKAMSRLTHPNCVAVTDFGVDQGSPYLVMDYLTGRSLRELLRLENRLPPEKAVGVVRQVLAGLSHAHAQGIIHRDIKPENILEVSVEGHGEQMRIVDFGLAKLRDQASVTTGVALGTPGYMSPEQTVGEKVDERTDVYATGILLYELLVGWKPFHAESPFEVMRMHREVQPPPLAQAAPDIAFSDELEHVIQRALAKLRNTRFPSAATFLDALEATPEARAGNPVRAAAGIRLPMPKLVAAAVAAAGIGVLWWWLS